MAELKVPVIIDGMDFVKDVIKNSMESAEFNETASEDYKKGFYDFGNS